MAKVSRSLRRQFARRLTREMDALLLRQTSYVADQLRARTITADALPDDYLDEQDAANELADTLSPILRDAAQTSGAAVAKQLRANYTHDPDLDSELANRARIIAVTITNTTRSDLSRLITAAESDDEAAADIEDYGQRGSRASTIGITEIAVAITAATLAAGKQAQGQRPADAPAHPEWTWTLSADHSDVDFCDDYDGITVLDESEFGDGPPPAHTNCGCELVVDMVPDAVTASGHVEVETAGSGTLTPSERATVMPDEPSTTTVITVSGPVVITAAPDGQGAWHAILCLEDFETTDGRRFMPGSLSTRELPLPLMYLTETGDAHDGAKVCGAITAADRDADFRIIGSGIYDTGDDGQEAQRLVRDQILRWVSVDVEAIEYELVFPLMTEEDLMGDQITITEADEPSFVLYKGNLMGATICPFPAFPQAVIAPMEVPLPDAAQSGQEAAQSLGMASGPLAVAACADRGDSLPPASWFENPQLSRPTIPTVNDDGRVYGHIARWDIPHIGYQGRQVHAPRSSSSYAYYMTGVTRAQAEEGPTDIRTGRLVMNAPHAALNLDHHAAASHYDDTGSAVADVVVGEDDWGIWMSGAIRNGVTDAQARILRSSGAVSGDWRQIGGRLEMVGLLVVNAPGFPIGNLAASAGINVTQLQTRGRVEAGELVALVAAGCPASMPTQHDLGASVEKLEQRLRRFEVDQMRRRIGVGA